MVDRSESSYFKYEYIIIYGSVVIYQSRAAEIAEFSDVCDYRSLFISKDTTSGIPLLSAP